MISRFYSSFVEGQTNNKFPMEKFPDFWVRTLFMTRISFDIFLLPSCSFYLSLSLSNFFLAPCLLFFSLFHSLSVFLYLLFLSLYCPLFHSSLSFFAVLFLSFFLFLSLYISTINGPLFVKVIKIRRMAAAQFSLEAAVRGEGAHWAQIRHYFIKMM